MSYTIVWAPLFQNYKVYNIYIICSTSIEKDIIQVLHDVIAYVLLAICLQTTRVATFERQ